MNVKQIALKLAHVSMQVKCYIFIETDFMTRDKIMNEINKSESLCFVGSCPEIYLEKAFDQSSLRPKKRLPNSRNLGETSLMFNIHPTISLDELERILKLTNGVISKYLS